jgi:hypothetical protein
MKKRLLLLILLIAVIVLIKLAMPSRSIAVVDNNAISNVHTKSVVPADCEALSPLIDASSDSAHLQRAEVSYIKTLALLDKCQNEIFGKAEKNKIAIIRHYVMETHGSIRCMETLNYKTQAMRDLNSGFYQRAYNDANSGIALVDQCNDVDAQLMIKAFLLSFRGLAEYHLSQADWQTDINQANTLLVECQTRPAFYGTRQGAKCETQEQYNIRASTRWEME